jgi:hypothetical protein
MLADTVAVAATGETPEGPSLDPDDINNRLAEVAVELAAEARFREPSAAERARRPVGPAKPAREGPLRWLGGRRVAAHVRPRGALGPARPRPHAPRHRDRGRGRGRPAEPAEPRLTGQKTRSLITETMPMSTTKTRSATGGSRRP